MEDNEMTLIYVLLITILISNIGVGFLVYALVKVLLEDMVQFGRQAYVKSIDNDINLGN